MDARENALVLRRRLEDALSAHDQPRAVATALAAVADGSLDTSTLYTRVLGPMLADVGARWRTGEMRVWEEHLTSAAVRTIVEALYPRVREEAAWLPQRGPVVLACPPEELHDLGLRMLADRLALAGWQPAFLGADTPVADIAAAARALDAKLVVLSASTHFGKVRLAEYVAQLRTLLGEVRLAVGGPAFEGERDARLETHSLTAEDLAPLRRAADDSDSEEP